jgi:iron complex outermembrane receptor protein
LNYRRVDNRFQVVGPYSFASSQQDLYGGFIQDDISLVPQRLKLSLGAKLDHNPMTGVEFQPSVRAIWTDPAGWSLWGAVSRAVRTPATYESDDAVNLGSVVVVPSQVQSEVLTALEIGWRGRISSWASLDVTAYDNSYRDLIALRATFGVLNGVPGVQLAAANVTQAHARGVEASLDAHLRTWWTVKAAASWQDIRTDPPSVVYYPLGSLGGERSPKGQVSLRSMVDLGDNVDLDLWVRHVGALGDGLTKAYTNLDLRVAWRPTPMFEVSLHGTNLLGRRGSELRTDLTGYPDASALADRRLLVAVSARY